MVDDRHSTTVDEYLERVDPERREVLEGLRDLVVEHLPDGFEEMMLFGMPTYAVPLARYPDTYNGKPLVYVSFAAQKRYTSLYLMCLYAHSDQEWDFQERWAGGRALDMGKSCIRFRRLEDLDRELIAETIAATGVDDYIDLYERSYPR